MERYVKFYGKNNPFIINVGHAFENFLQKCDYVEPLPEGITQFTGMMASIIRDVYDIDVEALTRSAQEIRGEPDPVEEAKPPVDTPEPVFDNEELKELGRGIFDEKRARAGAAEDVRYASKVDRILM